MPTILCIDDNATGLATRKAFLESNGYCVLTAQDGISGLALLFTPGVHCGNCGSGGHVDAVVLDYRMPGMMGDAVAAIIRNEKPDLPLVMLTGYPQDFLQSPVPSLVDAVITKGEHPEVLLTTLKRLTGTKPEKPSAKVRSAVEEARKLRELARAIRSEQRRFKDRRLQSDRRRTVQKQVLPNSEEEKNAG